MAAPQLTAIILTLNERAHIADCVASLSWCDRVVVFDAISRDETVALALAAGAEVQQSAFSNYAQQRNAALASVDTDWVLFVDADERATAELGDEVRRVIAGREESGWYVPRLNFIFGRLTRGAGWYPDYQLRLFRHGAVRYERPVHEIAVVDGEVGYLKNPLLHHNYRDATQFHQKQRRYTQYDATVLRDKGIRPHFYTPWSQAVRQFWWRFVTLKGYQDRLHGLRLSAYMAYYEWLKYRHLTSLQS
jgi:glycosyltransferase involved in cell wall biosynthesis